MLEAPGPHCVEGNVITTPYAVAVIRDAYYDRVVFPNTTVERDCSPPPPPQECDLECGTDTHCELVHVVCFRAPCDPIPECVPDSCEVLSCEPGTHCELEPQVGCSDKASCPPIPECVADRDRPPPPPPCTPQPCPDGKLCPILDCHPRPLDPCFDVDCGEGQVCQAEADRPHCVPLSKP